MDGKGDMGKAIGACSGNIKLLIDGLIALDCEVC